MTGIDQRTRARGSWCILLLLLGVTSAVLAAEPQHAECVAPSTWLRLSDKRVVDNGVLLKEVSAKQVVLLGELHDNPDHHRWQLQVIAGLYALRPRLAIGFEMFPHEVQPVLDKWVAGKLSEAEFLSQSNWRGNWSFDPALYLPLFHFARINHIAMIALNVPQTLIMEVREKGWAAVPAERRQGVTDPAPPDPAYLEMLASSFLQHRPGAHGHGDEKDKEMSPEEKQAFQRFVQGQQLWDRAMAQAIAAPVLSDQPLLVVGIMGSGHMMNGFGVPHQLAALKVAGPASLLPADEEWDCDDLAPDFAYAVFGMRPAAVAEEEKPRLGIYLEPAEQGVKVAKLMDGSVAAAGGIMENDLIVEIAGSKVRTVSDVISVVQHMAPGTWLPLTVLRGGKRVEIVAKFPPRGS